MWGVVIIGLVAAASWLWTPDKPRESLEARYAAAPSRFVEVAGAHHSSRAMFDSPEGVGALFGGAPSQ